MDNEWLVLIVRTNIRRLKGFVGLDSLRRTRAINSQTRAELMFLLFRSRRALHKLWQFLRSFQWEMALAETFAVWHTQNVSILCVNTKRCFKLCSDTPLGIQMRLKIWLLIWIRPELGFCSSLLPVFTENPDTRESQLSALWRYLVTILRMWQFILLLVPALSARHLARISATFKFYWHELSANNLVSSYHVNLP